MNENDNEDGYDGSRWRFNKMIYVRSKDEDDKEDRDDDEASYFYEIIKNRFEKNKKYYIDYDHEKYINKNLENYLIKNESLCACNGLILPFKFRFNKLKILIIIYGNGFSILALICSQYSLLSFVSINFR